ncbi:hypothetical protein MTO96_045279, partial [Rhipicephalus appendiculatus]
VLRLFLARLCHSDTRYNSGDQDGILVTTLRCPSHEQWLGQRHCRIATAHGDPAALGFLGAEYVTKGTEGFQLVTVDAPDGLTRRHLDQLRRRVSISPVAAKAEPAYPVRTCPDNGEPQPSAQEEQLSPPTPLRNDAVPVSSTTPPRSLPAEEAPPESSGVTKAYPTTKTSAKTVAFKEKEK